MPYIRLPDRRDGKLLVELEPKPARLLMRNSAISWCMMLAWEDSSSLAAAHSSLVAELVWTTAEIWSMPQRKQR